MVMQGRRRPRSQSRPVSQNLFLLCWSAMSTTGYPSLHTPSATGYHSFLFSWSSTHQTAPQMIYSLSLHIVIRSQYLARCVGAVQAPRTWRTGPCCKSKTGRQNQDRSRLLTNHKHSSRDRLRPVLDCNATQARYISWLGSIKDPWTRLWFHYV